MIAAAIFDFNKTLELVIRILTTPVIVCFAIFRIYYDFKYLFAEDTIGKWHDFEINNDYIRINEQFILLTEIRKLNASLANVQEARYKRQLNKVLIISNSLKYETGIEITDQNQKANFEKAVENMKLKGIKIDLNLE
jgi:hypothetical protein